MKSTVKPAPTIRLDSLTLNPDNPRTLSKAAFEKLKDSIKRDPEFMPLRPIVIDEHRMILGGNQRYRAIQALGRKTIPATWVQDGSKLTKEQKKRFILVDNYIKGMAGDWDFEILANAFNVEELRGVGFADWELGIGIESINHANEWQGMPEFVNEDKKSFRHIVIHMDNQEAVDNLSALLQQPINEKTKWLWHPKMARDSVKGIAYIDP